VEHRSAILNLPNEVPIGQNADHRDMARFESPTDRNYRPVASRLQKFHDDIANKELEASFRRVTVDLAQSGRRTKLTSDYWLRRLTLRRDYFHLRDSRLPWSDIPWKG
jgi:hypothetical protein